jgi:FdhD protein
VAKSIETRVVGVQGATEAARPDHLACEEPLEIRAQGPEQEPVRIAVTMRTPGEDKELAVGFLFGEGLLVGRDDLGRPAVRELAVEGSPGSVVTVRTVKTFDATRLARNFYATSSCGVCGKAAIEHVQANAPPIHGSFRIARSVLVGLPDKLRAAQSVFRETGGLHATGAFDAQGELVAVREDVGRHNAMDRSSGGSCSTGASRSRRACSSCRAARASSSCRRPRWRASRSSAPCRPRRASPWTRRGGSA